MSLAHWNSFSLFENHPIHQQGSLPPTNNRHICSAASPCWLCGGKVPKVDVKHVKCYPPYLLGHWIFMRLDTGVSLQPAVQRTSSSLYSHQTSLILWHAAPSILHTRPLLASHLRLFSNKGGDFARSWQPLPGSICKAEPCCSSLRDALGRVSEGTPRRRRGGMREAITLCSCSAVMPIYSPWHHRGHALTSAGISPPSPLSLMRFLSPPKGETAPNSLCITRAFGRPGCRSASSRLPWLLFGSAVAAAAELRCGGQTHLAWQRRLQWLSH